METAFPSAGGPYGGLPGPSHIGRIPHGVDLRLVARRQKYAIYLVLAAILNWFLTAFMSVRFGPIIAVLGGFLMIAIQLLLVVGVVLMLSATRTHVAVIVVCAILMFAPCVNLIVLLFVNQGVTRTLRRAGIRVGFMGARDEDAERAMDPMLCRVCGYNLTGNVSGRCPECGTLLPRATPVVPRD